MNSKKNQKWGQKHVNDRTELIRLDEFREQKRVGERRTQRGVQIEGSDQKRASEREEDRITGDGGVRLVRMGARLFHNGKTSKS